MSFTILQAATFPAGLREKIDPSLKVVGPFGFPVGATLTAEEAAEVRVLITMGTLATETTVMDRLPNLGLICCYGTGYEGVDVVAAVRRGIQVTHSPGANAAPEVARQIGVRDSTVYSWLSGESRPTNPERIAAFLDSILAECGGGIPPTPGIALKTG